MRQRDAVEQPDERTIDSVRTVVCAVRPVALGLCAALALGACSDGDGGGGGGPFEDGRMVVSGGDTVIPNPGSLLGEGDDGAPSDTGDVSDDMAGAAESGAGDDTAGGEPIESNPDATVADPDGDDRAGLTVEGFSSQSVADAVSPWLVNARFFRNVSRAPISGDAFIDLVPYGSSFRVARHVSFYATDLDTCTILRTPPTDEIAGDPDPGASGDRGPASISGGSFVTINSGGSVFAVAGIESLRDTEEVVYTSRRGLPGPLPGDATLSIPGDAFPAVTDFPLASEPPVPVRLLPAVDDAIDENADYSWMPGSGNDFVRLDFLAFDPATETGNPEFAAFCDVVDDGSFELPADLREFLGNLQDELAPLDENIRVRYARIRDAVTFWNGIVFRTSISVAE